MDGNSGRHTGFNKEPKIELDNLVHIREKKLASIPGIKEAEDAAKFLALNGLGNTEVARILKTGSSRLNGGYEIALRGKQHAEEHNISEPINGAQLEAMSKFDDVEDGFDLISRALQSLMDQNDANSRLAQRIIEGCRNGNWPPSSESRTQPVTEI